MTSNRSEVPTHEVHRNRFVDPVDVDYPRLFDLSGQTHVVVGAGRGIGETTTRLLHSMGANVVCVDLDEARGKDVADSINAPLVIADVTEQSGVTHVLESAVAAFGPRIHGLVDIVGGGRGKLMDDYTSEDWEWDFRMNLKHAFLLGKTFGPHMKANSGGAMVFISSIFGWFASRTQPGYPPSKAALMAWTKQLAEEFGPYGVRANSVAPGIIATEKLVSENFPPEVLEAMSDRTFLRRVGQPYEIASTAVFLLSDAAGYITGQNINVEGGTMSMNPLGFGENHSKLIAQSKPYV